MPAIGERLSGKAKSMLSACAARPYFEKQQGPDLQASSGLIDLHPEDESHIHGREYVPLFGRQFREENAFIPSQKPLKLKLIFMTCLTFFGKLLPEKE